MNFNSIGEMLLSVAEILKPSERLSVSQAAEKYRKINNPGAYVGDWKNKTVPYMVEPMDEFTARRFKGEVFVGPAQSGKTDGLIINTILHTVKCEPMDIMLVCPSNTAARDFSMRRIDRLHQHSEEIGAMMLPGADNDNKFDKQYRNGMMLTLSWPTPTELAGKPIGRVLMTDYDRMPEDVGPGDGNAYDLASKRTQTFGSYAMCLAESSPSKEVTNDKWIPSTLHEAPPAPGILELYNRGDRRRWYWPCPDCGKFFEGKFSHMIYKKIEGQSNIEVADSARMKCPHCAYEIEGNERADMNLGGRWLKEGEWIEDGKTMGKGKRSRIASFWLFGVAAAFTNWRELVTSFLDADDAYRNTGSEDALRKFYNNDLSEPYYPKSMTERRSPEVLKSRAEKIVRTQHVPPHVRFTVALIDVQKNMFICQVFGILPGKPFDTVLIDRFEVKKSKRLDADGDAAWVKPHAYLEDWDELIPNVIRKTYPLDDDTGRVMGIHFVGCDSGGKEGVTTMAYNFYRRLREDNLNRRFILIKGDHAAGQPRARISYPDSSRKDAKAGARGDIPVLLLNSNILKDDLNGRLECITPTKGMFRFPDYLADSFFMELCAEVREPTGWKNPSNRRNEAWDLAYYCIGLCVSELIRIEALDWDNPPAWAAPWDDNDQVRAAKDVPEFANVVKSPYDFSEFGKSLA
jgi:phage terminase large subunit GpA-like protein